MRSNLGVGKSVPKLTYHAELARSNPGICWSPGVHGLHADECWNIRLHAQLGIQTDVGHTSQWTNGDENYHLNLKTQNIYFVLVW